MAGFLDGILGGMGGGAGGGGPLGMLGMDFGLHKMPIIGNFFQNPAEIHKQLQFQRGAQAYDAYRPEAAQARMNAMNNVMANFQGPQNVMSAMMGGRQPTPQTPMPMGPSMMQVGRSMPGQTQNGGIGGFMGGGGPMGMFGNGGPMGLLGGM